MSRIARVLIIVSERGRVPIEPDEVYFLEAVGDDPLVRLPPGLFTEGIRVLRFRPNPSNHVASLARIQDNRRRKGKED